MSTYDPRNVAIGGPPGQPLAWLLIEERDALRARLAAAEEALRPFADAVTNPDAEVDNNDYLRAAAYFDTTKGGE